MGLDSDTLNPDPTNLDQVEDVPASGRRRKGVAKQLSPEKSKRVKVDADPGEKGNPEPCLDQVLRDEIDIVEDLSISSPVKKSVRIKKPSPKKAETMELEETVKSKRNVEDNNTIKKRKSDEMQPVMPVENKTTSSEPSSKRKLKTKVSKPCSPNQNPRVKTEVLKKKKGNLKPKVNPEDPSSKRKPVSEEVSIPESDRSPFKKPLLSGATVERRESSESRISVDNLKISGRPRKRRDSNSSSVSNSSDTSSRSVRSRHGSSSSNTSDTCKKEKSKPTKMPDNLPVVPLLSRRKGRKVNRIAAADGSGPVKTLKKKVLKKSLSSTTSKKPEENESSKTTVVAKKKKTVTAKDNCKSNEASSSASKPSQADSIKSDSSPTKEEPKPVKVKSKNSAGQEKQENSKAKTSVVKSPIKGSKANKEGPSMGLKKKKKVVKKTAPVKPVPDNDDDDTDVEDGMTLVHVDDEITLNISDESLIQLQKMKTFSNPKSSQTNEEAGSSKSLEIKKPVGRKKKLAKTETVTDKESSQAETKNKNKEDGSSKSAAKADVKAIEGVLKKKNLETSEGVNNKKKKMEDGSVKKAAIVNEAGVIKKNKKKRILEEDGILKKKMVGGVVKKKTGIAGGKRKGRSGANTRSVNLHL